MELTRQELLRAHAVLDSVEVPREAEEGGEKLSISQRVEHLAGAYRAAVRTTIELTQVPR
jgi:hypothetical protein